jgi:hypothetical protein
MFHIMLSRSSMWYCFYTHVAHKIPQILVIRNNERTKLYGILSLIFFDITELHLKGYFSRDLLFQMKVFYIQYVFAQRCLTFP